MNCPAGHLRSWNYDILCIHQELVSFVIMPYRDFVLLEQPSIRPDLNFWVRCHNALPGIGAIGTEGIRLDHQTENRVIMSYRALVVLEPCQKYSSKPLDIALYHATLPRR